MRKDIIKKYSDKLKIPFHWLDGLINFETAGTYSPTKKNPYSSARGLIQFVDATARSLGYASSHDLVTKNPTFEKQMIVVYQYLKRFGPFPTDRDFYMSVFYPKYRRMPVDTMFPDRVLRVNPGITTVLSYINYVRRKAGIPVSNTVEGNTYIEKGLVIAGFFTILVGGYLIFRKK